VNFNTLIVLVNYNFKWQNDKMNATPTLFTTIVEIDKMILGMQYPHFYANFNIP
jgi:hypothetical protein